MDFVECMLESCKSSLTVGPINDDPSPTNYPVPSQQHPNCGDWQPETTASNESNSAVTCEPAQTRATELNIATEPEYQMCEPAASSIAEGVNVEFVGMEVSTALPPATETECLAIALENCFDFGEVDFFPLCYCLNQSVMSQTQ